MASPFDFVFSILDEIALEGLEGITLEMLWYRLADRPNFTIAIDSDSQNFFWNNIAKHRDVEIFQLPDPRPFVAPFDRYQFIDPELEVVVEPPDSVPDCYFNVVPIKDGDIRGACSAYSTRSNITSLVRCNDVLLMSLDQVKKRWSDTLVLVASPKARLIALIGTEVNPLIDLSLEAYCLLERIGRSRYLGEVTQGEGGLLALKACFCRQMHYYRKKLSTKGLITKQLHYMKSRKGNTTNGSLFHLTRFFMQRKTKMAMLMKRLCDILRDKPNMRETCMALKKELGVREKSFKKLFYRPFQKWVRLDTVSVSELYPNAEKKFLFTLHGHEKIVKMVQLVRHCDEDEDLEGDQDEENEKDKILPPNVHFDPGAIYFGVPLAHQTYCHVKDAGPDGISSADLARRMTLPRLDIRNLLRLLMKKEVIVSVLQDRGRQKVTKYIAKSFEDQNEAYAFVREQDLLNQEAAWEDGNVNDQSRKRAAEENGNAAAAKRAKLASESVDVQEARNGEGRGKRKRQEVEGNEDDCNFHKIVSKVLEVQNHEHFTGKAPKMVSFSDNPKVPKPYNVSRQVTYRKLVRSRVIISFVKTERLTTLSDIQKHVLEEERKEGYNFRLDKKSTARLVYNLYKNKKLKIFKAILKLDSKQTNIEFVCDNDMEPSDPLIQVAIEQAKFKYFGVSKNVKSPAVKHEEPQLVPTSDSSSTPPDSESIVPRGISFSPAPKFVRAKLLHMFFHYLVYQHKGEIVKSSEQHVYNNSMTWRRFVSPLPNYSKNEGWCFLVDICSRMPISLFLKLFRIRGCTAELNAYLQDEEKSHYLVTSLPASIRNILYNDRKYVISLFEIIHNLCYMGLLSVGPKLKPLKDHVFMYVHKCASIKDTTVAKPSYIHLQTDVNFEVKLYTFTDEESVENFWVDLENVSFHTPLGKYSTVFGTTYTVTEAKYKPDLKVSTQHKGYGDVIDDGTIPGDGVGACGYDSSLYLHCRRNWQHSSSHNAPGMVAGKRVTQPQPLLQNLLKEKEKKPETRSRLQRLVKNNVLLLQKENRSKVAKPALSMKDKTKPKKLLKKRPVVITRTVRNRSKKERVPYYDEKDRAAMEKMDKFRCDWSSKEDSFLLLCKVASCFLEPNDTKNLVVPYTVVRDFLHEHIPGISANKSSRACQRRVRYMMLNPTTTNNVNVFLGEALQDTNLVREFNRPKPNRGKEQERAAMFTVVLKRLLEKFTLPASDRCMNLVLPNSLPEFQERYRIIEEPDVFNRKSLYQPPENVEDINMFVLKSLILSAMAVVPDGTEWSYLTHKLYQSYTESELKAAISLLRKQKILAVKKRSGKKDVQRSLRSACPYKFSVTYTNAMLTKVPSKIFSQSRCLLDNLHNLKPETHVELKGDIPPGYAAGVLSLVMTQQLAVHTQIPDQIIIFDDSLSKEARSNIVERMIQTLSERESMELTQLLNKEDKTRDKNSTQSNSNVDMVASCSTQLPDGSQVGEGQRFANASRFALYLLRQEMSQPPIERVQHSQDYIVLNSCRVFCRLRANALPPAFPLYPAEVVEDVHVEPALGERVKPANPPQQVGGRDRVKPSESVVRKDRGKLTKHQLFQVRTILLTYIPDDSLLERQDYSEQIAFEYRQDSQATLDDAIRILSRIYESKVEGISEKDIWTEFENLTGDLSLFQHLTRLRNAFMVIRVGVDSFGYVCGCFAKKWVLRSQKLSDVYKKKRKTKKALDSPQPGTSFENPNLSILSNSENLGVCCSEDEVDSCCACDDEMDSSNVEESEQVHSSTGDRSSPDKKKILNFLPRTWRNPDGSLNKTVLFQFLANLLSHIMSVPGTCDAQICDRFRLVLPPVQTLELLEVLEKASCIYKYYCKPTKKVSLFSATKPITITENPGPFDLDHIEPYPDALCRVDELQKLF